MSGCRITSGLEGLAWRLGSGEIRFPWRTARWHRPRHHVHQRDGEVPMGRHGRRGGDLHGREQPPDGHQHPVAVDQSAEGFMQGRSVRNGAWRSWKMLEATPAQRALHPGDVAGGRTARRMSGRCLPAGGPACGGCSNLAKAWAFELFTQLADDMDYFVRLEDEYYAASDQSIQVAMAVTQRISGALQDALPEDADVQAMAERMKQLRKDNTDRQRGEFSDPPVFTRTLMSHGRRAAKVAILASGTGRMPSGSWGCASEPMWRWSWWPATGRSAQVLERAERCGVPTWSFGRADLNGGVVTAHLVSAGGGFCRACRLLNEGSGWPRVRIQRADAQPAPLAPAGVWRTGDVRPACPRCASMPRSKRERWTARASPCTGWMRSTTRVPRSSRRKSRLDPADTPEGIADKVRQLEVEHRAPQTLRAIRESLSLSDPAAG